MDIDIFKQCLISGNKLQAKVMLEDFLSSSISPSQQAETLIGLATVYMETENALNQEYLQILKNIKKELGKLDKENAEDAEKLQLAMARLKIKE